MVDIWERNATERTTQCSFCKKPESNPYRFNKGIRLCKNCYFNNHKKTVIGKRDENFI